MDVVWSATEVKTRRYSPVPIRSDAAGLDERFQHLRRRRIRGFIEVEIPDTDAPRLSMGFRGMYAVIRMVVRVPGAPSFLLAGDGSVPDGAYGQVPIVDDLVRFDGEYLIETDRAWDLMLKFLDSGEAGDLGVWRPFRAGLTD